MTVCKKTRYSTKENALFDIERISKKRSKDDVNVRNDGKPYKEKKTVVGIIERDGKVILKYVPRADKMNLLDFIKSYVPNNSTVYTDENRSYTELKKTYTHESVTHSLSIYVDGDVYTNTIENFWSILKRGLYGVYHQVSDKHISRYLDEFSARFNTRRIDADERFEKFLNQGESVLPYKQLIAN